MCLTVVIFWLKISALVLWRNFYSLYKSKIIQNELFQKRAVSIFDAVERISPIDDLKVGGFAFEKICILDQVVFILGLRWGSVWWHVHALFNSFLHINHLLASMSRLCFLVQIPLVWNGVNVFCLLFLNIKLTIHIFSVLFKT